MKIPDSHHRFIPSDRDAAPADSTVKRGRYVIRGRIWIEGDDGTFLGYGRVELLERIERFGSISQAARSMNMSYRHAWELVDSINRQAKSPLVETSVGGRKGGGARLTERGRKAVDSFRALYEAFREFLRSKAEGLDL
ncbi:MAG: winged helix-turn-helix domain-containing protein [Deltaproteobacteria bacterium]